MAVISEVVATHTRKWADALEGTKSTQKAKRSTLLMQLKHALGKHAFTEENVIYPALREAGRVEEADELNKEHGYVKQYLYELENMAKDSPNFLPTVRRFRADIESHMADEETNLFPSLRAGMSEEKNKHLTFALQAVKSPDALKTIIAQLKEKLEEANVPDGQSWIVIPPFLKAQLVIAGVKFQINNGINGTGMIGYTTVLGCDLFVSNQLAASGGKTVCLAGSYSAIAYAEQVLETQVIDRLENSFDTAIRGRIVFGAKVIKPNELVACPVGNGGYSI